MSSTTKFMDITITDYTEKSIAVQGDTRKYKEDLKKLGGKYNGMLKNGPGWIFSKTNEAEVRSFINGGKRLVSETEAIQGEELSRQRAKEWAERETKTVQVKPIQSSTVIKPSISNSSPTLSEYSILVNLIKSMSNKIDFLEQAMGILLNDEQKEKLKDLTKPKLERNKPTIEKVMNRKKNTTDSDDCDNCESDIELEEEIPTRRLLR